MKKFDMHIHAWGGTPDPDGLLSEMEGAGVYYASLMERVPFFEIRTVSNAVGERDTSKWNSREALDTLEECCREIFSVI